MSELAQLVAGGLMTGTVYAGLALALSVVYAGSGVLNFSQGQMAVVSAFLALEVVDAGYSFWLALVVGTASGAALGAVLERVLVRPVENAPVLARFTVTAALLLGLSGLVPLLWDNDQHSVAGPFGDAALEVGQVAVTATQAGAAVTVLLVMALVAAFLRWTPLGLQLRAVASNAQSAALLGVRPGSMLTLGWAVGGAVGASVAVMASPMLSVGVDMMSGPLLLALAASSLGGLDSRVGVVAGGLAVGVLAALAGRYVPGLGGDLALLLPFAVVWVVLVARPAGLFGRGQVVRA